MSRSVLHKSPRTLGVSVSLTTAAMLVTPVLLVAQVAQSRPPAPAKARAVPAVNSCVRLKQMPSKLVGSPEGMEIEKMRQELAVVGERMTQRPDTLNPEKLKSIFVVKGGVDSLTRMYVSTIDSSGNTVTVQVKPRTPGDASPPGLSEADRVRFEMMIREMQGRVDAAVRGSGPVTIGTINIRSTAAGYLGVTTAGSTFPSMPKLEQSFGYCEYPRVESVEPGSPAAKVGLSAGDTLLAYNGRDLLKYDVNFKVLLVPGKQLRVTFRREGEVREVLPTIMPRPDQRVFIAQRPFCADPDLLGGCEPLRVPTRVLSGLPMPASGGNAQGGSMDVRVGPGGTMPAGNSLAFPARKAPPEIIIDSDGQGGGSLGGAQLTAVSEEFARNMGVEPGIIAMKVPVGSPAYDSGLRSGDVILTANGKAVRDLNGLLNALLMKSSYGVLRVSNKATGMRTVTLRLN